jgi:hypothetical protein
MIPCGIFLRVTAREEASASSQFSAYTYTVYGVSEEREYVP